MRKPYSDINDQRLQWLEKDFPTYLRKWKEVVDNRPLVGNVDRKKMFLTQKTEEGLLVACFSMSTIIKSLNAGAKYVLTRRINQDPLELCFGHQRQRGRHHDAPTVRDLASNSRNLDILKHTHIAGSNVHVE